jgi:hypothetical protein
MDREFVAGELVKVAKDLVSDKMYTKSGNPRTPKKHEWDYRLLSRMMRDFDYTLNESKQSYGGANHLYMGDFDKQLKEMKKLWNRLSDEDKPEWLTKRDIADYEKKIKKLKKSKSAKVVVSADKVERYATFDYGNGRVHLEWWYYPTDKDSEDDWHWLQVAEDFGSKEFKKLSKFAGDTEVLAPHGRHPYIYHGLIGTDWGGKRNVRYDDEGLRKALKRMRFKIREVDW